MTTEEGTTTNMLLSLVGKEDVEVPRTSPPDKNICRWWMNNRMEEDMDSEKKTEWEEISRSKTKFFEWFDKIDHLQDDGIGDLKVQDYRDNFIVILNTFDHKLSHLAGLELKEKKEREKMPSENCIKLMSLENLRVHKKIMIPRRTSWVFSGDQEFGEEKKFVPNELLFLIFTFLAPRKDYCKYWMYREYFKVISLVCRRWYVVCNSKELFHNTVSIERIKGKAKIFQMLDTLRALEKKKKDLFSATDHIRSFREPMRMFVYDFVEYKINGNRCLKEENSELVEGTSKMSEKLLKLQNTMKADLAKVFLWETIDRFGKPSKYSYGYLLDRFLFYQKHYNLKVHNKKNMHGSVEKDIVDLKKTIEEKKSGRENEIEGLIFDLRTLNGNQFCQPGSCDLGWDPRKDKSPYKKLQKLGIAVIPYAMKYYDSRVFTRSVEYWRNFTFSHTVIRVGQALRRLLYPFGSNSLALTELYKDFKEKGKDFYRYTIVTKMKVSLLPILKNEIPTDEKIGIIDQLLKADQSSKLGKLVKRRRQTLFSMLMEIGNKKTEKIVIREAEKGDVDCVLNFFFQMYERKDLENANLKKMSILTLSNISKFNGDDYSNDFAKMVLVMFLTDNLELLKRECLSGKVLKNRPDLILRCISMFTSSFGRNLGKKQKEIAKKLKKERMEKILDFCFSFIDDDRREKVSSSRGNLKWEHPRIKDKAANHIYMLDKRYVFKEDFFPYSNKRKDKIIEKNFTNLRLNKNESKFDIPVAKAVMMTKKIKDLIVSKNFSELFKFGSGIVHTIREAVAQCSLDEKEYSDFLTKMSFVVFNIDLMRPEGYTKNEYCEQFIGQPLTTKILVDLFRKFKPYYVLFERDVGETGIDIKLFFRPFNDSFRLNIWWKVEGNRNDGFETFSRFPKFVKEYLPQRLKIEDLMKKAGSEKAFCVKIDLTSTQNFKHHFAI